jgi:phage major head subunit gpT-like protein
MAVTPSQLNLFISTVNTAIGQVYSDLSLPQFWQEFSTEIHTESTQWVAAWTGMLPKARTWKGSRVVVSPNVQTYVAVPQPYEHTMTIDRFHLDDDQYGYYYRALPDQARQIRRLPDLWMRDLLEASGDFTGVIQNGYDGLTYFNTSHPVNFWAAGMGTYSNDFTGGGSTQNGVLVGGAFGVTSVATLAEYMMRLKGEDGEPLGVYAGLVMVPPALMMEANLVLKETSFAPPAWGTITGQVGAADNPILRFGMKPLVNPYLTNPTRWYMFDTTKGLKPLLRIVRETAHMAPRVSEQDPVVFDTHHFLWGWWGRETPAWGFSFLGARSGP